MKALIIGLLLLIGATLNAKNMKDPHHVVTQLFVSTDQRNWSAVEACFADEVVLDYSSMNGNPAATLTPAEIVTSWQGILPGFEHTHHQLGNLITSEEKGKAHVFAYGTATHHLSEAAGNIWTVVGSYDFDLIRGPGKTWRISRMKFNFKYQDGNTALPEKAIRRVTEGGSAPTGDAATRNKETVRQFFRLLEEENIPAFIDLFAENGKQVNPYASDLFPAGAEGKEELRNYWTPVPGNFDGMAFPIREIYAMEDPNVVYVSYQGKIKLKDGAGTYENDYYSTFRFDEQGLITEYVEIFNPIVAARGFGLLDQISTTPEKKETMKKVSFESQGLSLTGNLYYPENYQPGNQYPAIVVSGSWTTVKEQMAGLYAEELAKAGYITLAFDFRNFGESEGEPRFYESPQLKKDDIQNAVTFLASLPEVDPEKIGAFGVCAGAMYTLMAASEDDRIRTVVTVASWLHDAEAVKLFYGGEEGVQAKIAAARDAREKYAANGTVEYIPSISTEDESAAMFGPYDYYLNPERGAIPEWSADKFAVMSWEDWLTADPMPSAANLTAPTLMIHSDGAVLPDYTKKYFEQIATDKKKLYWMDTELDSPFHQFNYYDQPAEVEESVKEAAKWFEHLK